MKIVDVYKKVSSTECTTSKSVKATYHNMNIFKCNDGRLAFGKLVED